MNEDEDLIGRLGALGRKSVETGVARRHLAAMAAQAGGGTRLVRRHRLKVVASFAVGLLAGTTGLASAGALPNGAQEVAHHALGAVGVNVPHGDRYQGPECGGTVKNHGQYVRSQPKGKRAEAAASRCGKPVQAGQDGTDSSGGATPAPGAGCQGPPPWAGKGKPDKAAKEARNKVCGDADPDGNEGKGPATAGPGSPNGVPQAPAAVTPASPTTEPTTPTTAPTTTTSSTTPTSTTTGPLTGLTTTTSGPGGETSTTTSTGPASPTTTVPPPVSGLPS